MTKSRSNRGRHRRHRIPRTDIATPDSPQPPHSDEQPVEPRVSSEREAAGPPGRDQALHLRRPEQQGPHPAQSVPQRGAQGSPGARPSAQRTGGVRTNRRRPQRKHQIVSIPGAVLKSKAPVTGSTLPIHLRALSEINGPEGPLLGCPMLTRTRLALPVTGGQTAPRCALAWALHSETEASYCMETHDLTQCWKVHPELLDEIKARLAERMAAD